MWSYQGPPNWRSKIQKRSLEPAALTFWLTARSETAALKRWSCAIVHDVMKPPYEPPMIPIRPASRKSNFSSAVSTTPMTSSKSTVPQPGPPSIGPRIARPHSSE